MRATDFIRSEFSSREAGFTLLEVMIASGLLGLLTLSAAQIFSLSSRSSKSVDEEVAFEGLAGQIQSVLDYNNTCGTSGYFPAGASAIQSPVGLSVGYTAVDYNLGTTIPITDFQLSPGIILHGAPLPTKFPLTGSHAGILTFQSMSITPRPCNGVTACPGPGTPAGSFTLWQPTSAFDPDKNSLAVNYSVFYLNLNFTAVESPGPGGTSALGGSSIKTRSLPFIGMVPNFPAPGNGTITTCYNRSLGLAYWQLCKHLGFRMQNGNNQTFPNWDPNTCGPGKPPN